MSAQTSEREEILTALLIEVQAFLDNLELPRDDLLKAIDILGNIKREIGE